MAEALASQRLERWWFHDLRRTWRTEASRIGVPSDAAERVLGHALDDLRGRYDKFDYLPQKRDALDRVAAHLLIIVAGAPVQRNDRRRLQRAAGGGA